MIEGQRKKPMVDGMYTRHVDYKHGKPKLSDNDKRKCQEFQARRVASKRQALRNAHDIMTGRLVTR